MVFFRPTIGLTSRRPRLVGLLKPPLVSPCVEAVEKPHLWTKTIFLLDGEMETDFPRMGFFYSFVRHHQEKMKIINLVLLQFVIFALVQPMSQAATNASLDAVLDIDDTDVQFTKAASAYVTVLRNMKAGNTNSGLLVYHPSKSLIVTNYHLVTSSSDPVNVYLNGPGNKLIGYPARFVRGNRQQDIAAFELIPDLTFTDKRVLKERGFKFADDGGLIIPDTNMFIDHNQFADDSRLQRGREVFFLGFPLSQGIAMETREIAAGPLTATHSEWTSKSPIVRFGRIASEIQAGDILLDAMVNHGNSGSPVFLRERAPREDGTRVTIKLVGMVKSFLSDNIAYKADNGHVLLLPHNSGLSQVVTASVISELLSKIE